MENKEAKREIMSSVVNIVDFIKTQVANDLATANARGAVNIKQKQIRDITRIVQDSITTSFVKASGQVEKAMSLIEDSKKEKAK